MDIIEAFATKNRCYKTGTPMKPVGIVVHSTGANNPNLKRYVDCVSECGTNQYGNTWNNYQPGGKDICVHAFIGYDKNKAVRVAQILPYDMACWGCGSGKNGSYNYNPTGHIQFEMCEDDLTNKTYFNKMWKTSVEYCVFLCKKFNLDPMTKGVLVGHNEAAALGYASNHADPEHWFAKHGKSMADFRKAVKLGMSGSSSAQVTGKLYRVQVGAYSFKANADAQAKKLKAAGFDTLIVFNGKLYKVQVGAFSQKANADNMLKKLNSAGFDGFIVS